MDNNEDYAGYEEEQNNEEPKKSMFEKAVESVTKTVRVIGDASYKIVHAGVTFKEEHPKEWEVYKWLFITVVGGLATKAVANHNRKIELANKAGEEALKMAKKNESDMEALCKHWDPRSMCWCFSRRPLDTKEIIEMDEAWKRGMSKAQFLASKGLSR